MATNLTAFINVHGQEWQAIKRYLEEQREIKLKELVGLKSHDESNVCRGAIQILDRLLNVEKDALIAFLKTL